MVIKHKSYFPYSVNVEIHYGTQRVIWCDENVGKEEVDWGIIPGEEQYHLVFWFKEEYNFLLFLLKWGSV